MASHRRRERWMIDTFSLIHQIPQTPNHQITRSPNSSTLPEMSSVATYPAPTTPPDVASDDVALKARDDTGPRALHEQGEGLFGVLGEFEDVASVMAAARATKDAGYRRFDVHSPFPIHGIDDAIGIQPTILPWIVLAGGLTGMITGLALTMFTMAADFGIPGPGLANNMHGYQYLISGKPLASLPAFIPVIFELTILLASFGAVIGMFLLNKLPLLANPFLSSELARRATDDRFVLAIDAEDGRFDPEETAAFLREHGAVSTELVSN